MKLMKILASMSEVTPWNVEAGVDEGIDYDKLIERFGSSRLVFWRVCMFAHDCL